MRVAIVGGAGFLGTATAASLTGLGTDVVVLDTARRLNRSRTLLTGLPTFAIDYADMRSIARRLRDMEGMIHLAWTTYPATSMTDIRHDATNIGMSVDLFVAAMEAGVRRIIFASSGGAVYGPPLQLPLSEAHRTRPLSAYGVSKLAVEGYLSVLTQTQDTFGISLRIGNAFGPYQLAGTPVGVIARYLTDIQAGRPLQVFGDGSVVRDFIYIDDVAAAFEAILLSPRLTSGVYNVGTGSGHSIDQVIGLLFEVTGREVAVRYGEPRPFDVRASGLDSSALSGLCGWQPRVAVREGVHRMWEQVLARNSRHSEATATSIASL